MRSKILLATLFVFSTSVFVNAQFNGAELDAKLEQNKKMLGNDVVTFVYKDGKIIYKKKLGEGFDEKTQVPISVSSRWLTTALVMQFIDEGKLTLDSKIADYLPIYAKYGKKYITIRHCLADLIGIESKKIVYTESARFESLEAMVNDYAKKEIRANTGTDFWYSNMGINMAARVVEVISKKDFEQLIAQKLLKPLGMKNTSFSPNNNACVSPATGAQSTANDYMNFLIMLLNKGSFNGKQILSAASVEQMQLPQMTASMIAYAPEEAKGFDFGLGGCIQEKDLEGKTAVFGCTNFMGLWPVVDVCRGYALLIFPRTFLVDAKKKIFSSLKESIDSQVTSNCK